jgi:hypothetical protein
LFNKKLKVEKAQEVKRKGGNNMQVRQMSKGGNAYGTASRNRQGRRTDQ